MDEIPNWEFCRIGSGQGDVDCMLCKGNGRKTGGFLGILIMVYATSAMALALSPVDIAILKDDKKEIYRMLIVQEE